MKKGNIFGLLTSAGLLGLATIGTAAGGPLGEMWLTAGDQNHMFQVSGNTTTQYALTGNEYGIAVFGSVGAVDVRTQGNNTGILGRQYVNGTPTGTTYSTTTNQIYDGAQDAATGTIYGIDFPTGNVYSFDQNWGNRNYLFTAIGTNDALGITFDSSDSTLYCLDRNAAKVSHYTLSGSLLARFDVLPGSAGLAIDLDGTFWSLLQGSQNIKHYDHAGNYMGTFSLGTDNNILGMEIVPSAVPEPTSIAVLGLGALGLLRRKRAKA